MDKNNSGIDFAKVRYIDSWVRHSVLGDPSFDSFKRHKANPVHRGVSPYEWPVNGFLFEDPKSDNCYIYVGHYPKGYYNVEAGCKCTVFESKDQGESWRHIGPVFSAEPFYFDGHTPAANHAPDVSVVYYEGKYHMVYDFLLGADVSKNYWNSGVGYAWSDSPTGPFRRNKIPLVFNEDFKAKPILGKYHRLYATTLVRRKNDWMLLTIVDSSKYYSWGLVGMISDKPEGPYSEPVPLFHTENDTHHPPLMEFFPCFVKEEYLYAPATAVALNRDFQIIYRVPLEKAMDPKAWDLFRYGSAWHTEDFEYEEHGIWGQAYSGFVDKENIFRIMYPSRDKNGLGTINQASRPWDKPLLSESFSMRGDKGNSTTCLRGSFAEFELKADLEFSGTVTLAWGMQGPLGVNAPRADATLHPLVKTNYPGLELSLKGWRMVSVNAAGEISVIATGSREYPDKGSFTLSNFADGKICIQEGKETLWQGNLPEREGRVGFFLEPSSFLKVNRFEIKGAAKTVLAPLLYTDGLLGAGQNMEHWEEIKSPLLRFGIGAVQKSDKCRAKWNFRGTGFQLWLPKDPEYGTVDVLLDGKLLKEINQNSEKAEPSAPIFKITDLPDTYHAVVLRPKTGIIAIDSLDVEWALLSK